MPNEIDIEKAIYYEVIAIPDPQRRRAYLDAVCRQDPELRKNVQALLDADEEAGVFLDGSPMDSVLDVPDEVQESVSLVEHAGATIGRYKLLETIGEGGFGVVFMAEQLEPIQRRVALKIIKAGMDTKQVIGRFEAERQALALMEHPNIAKVLDAGATETGRPYFVMELVRGIPVTKYCDNHSLTTLERLAIFNEICSAIQHAHQKGIIHRDVKPSNILVSTEGDRPVPKVIDFGIAKATQGPLTDKTVFTQFQQMIGTPAYMSPEQAELSTVDVDTRSDIYSLGVILYELLTGQTPLESSDLLSAGFDEIRRRIREDEPPKPSTRISNMTRAQRDTMAHHRKTKSDKLGSMVRGELDWIVMKAMSKDRARRYETANSLSLDVQRYLAGEPVSAAAPSTLYRLSKFANRNKAGIAVATVFIASLVLGLCAALVFFARERAARQLAQDQQYSSDMQLAFSTITRDDIAHTLKLLEANVPRDGQRDRRGWEWRHLWWQTHREVAAIRTYENGPAYVAELSLSPDGRTILAGAKTGGKLGASITLIDTVSRGITKTILLPDAGWIGGITRVSDQSTVAVETTDAGVVLIDLAEGAQRQRIKKGAWPPRMSPDGKWVAVIGQGLKLRLESLASPDQLPSDGQAVAIVAKIRDMFHFRVFDANGMQVADRSEAECVGKSQVLEQLKNELANVGDTSRLTPRQENRIAGQVAALVNHPSWITKRFRCFDVESGRQLGESVPFHIRDWDFLPLRIRLSPNGKLLAAGCAASKVFLFSAPDLRKVDEFEVDGVVSCVAWSPDSRSIAVGTDSRRKAVGIWDVQEGVQFCGFATSAPNRPAVRRLCYSPDASRLAVSTTNQAVTVWDVRNASEPIQFATYHHEGVADSMAFFADGNTLASSGANGIVRFWDTSFPDVTALSRTAEQEVWGLTLSPDGRLLATTGKDHIVRLFDTKTGDLVVNLLPQNDILVDPSIGNPHAELLCFSPDGRLLIAGNGDDTATVYDVTSRKPLWTLRDVIPEVIRDITVSPDSQTIVTARGWAVMYWNASDGTPQKEKLTSKGRVFAVEFSPDGRLLAFGGDDNVVTLWDTVEDRLLSTAPTGSNVHSIRFSADGKSLACGLKDEVWLFDTPSLTPRTAFQGLPGDVDGLAFSPDGVNLVVSCLGGIVRVFNLKLMSSVGDLLESPGWLGSVEFSTDGNTIAVADSVNGVHLFHATPDSRLPAAELAN